MRLFVALWPPTEVAAHIGSLARPDDPRVRWTTPDQWHVTLRFLGEVDEGLVGPINDALGAALALLPATEVLLGPQAERLGRSILAVPVSGADDIAAAVLAATSAAVPVAAERPFRGHLTLARARGRSAVPGELVGVDLTARWQVSTVTLVRSELRSTGARYHDLAGFPLVAEDA